jgi:hypothetical protein
MDIGNTYESQLGLRHCVLAGIRCAHEVGPMSSHVELCEHHAKDCLQAAERTEDPWAREMLLGTRWSGCGTGLQHRSNRSSVPLVDARQHRDRAWYIEAIYEPSLRQSPAP